MSPRLSLEACDRLKAAGVAAEVVILPGVPHTITAEGLAAAGEFFARG
jgi:acetyl esterase/lipase